MARKDPTGWFPRRGDYMAGKRAVTLLRKHLGPDLLLDLRRGLADSDKVLPGFSLWDVGGTCSPWEWCIPRPASAARLINVYEEYVDEEGFGRRSAPDRLARTLYSNTDAKLSFGEATRPSSHWLVPGCRLVLAAAHFGAAVEPWEGGLRATLDVDGQPYEMALGPQGAWSNTAGRAVAPHYRCLDSVDSELVVRPRAAAAPLKALPDLVEDTSLLWLANTICSEMHLRIDPLDLFAPTERDVEAKRRKAEVELAAREEMRERAIVAAREGVDIALMAADQVLPALYDVLVPDVCSASAFRKEFGTPSKAAGLQPAPEVRRKWADKIAHLEEEACRA